jgi:hypothetical protein
VLRIFPCKKSPNGSNSWLTGDETAIETNANNESKNNFILVKFFYFNKQSNIESNA